MPGLAADGWFAADWIVANQSFQLATLGDGVMVAILTIDTPLSCKTSI